MQPPSDDLRLDVAPLDPPEHLVDQLAQRARGSTPTGAARTRWRLAPVLAALMTVVVISGGSAWALGALSIPGLPDQRPSSPADSPPAPSPDGTPQSPSQETSEPEPTDESTTGSDESSTPSPDDEDFDPSTPTDPSIGQPTDAAPSTGPPQTQPPQPSPDPEEQDEDRESSKPSAPREPSRHGSHHGRGSESPEPQDDPGTRAPVDKPPHGRPTAAPHRPGHPPTGGGTGD